MGNSNNNGVDCQHKTGAIYCIINEKNNMCYVGLTTQKPVQKRINQHKHSKKSLIGQAIQESGWENNFHYEILENNIPADMLESREIFWITKMNCIFPNGYNRNAGGNVPPSQAGKIPWNKGIPCSEETKAKISVANKGNTFGRGNKNRIPWNKGISMPEEQKNKISAMLTGKHHSEETRAKISAGNKGKKRSEETRKKLSVANKGEKNPNYRKTASAETRAKMSKSRMGHTVSEETLRKIAETRKKNLMNKKK